MHLAQRLNSVTEPQTIKMAKMSRELKAKGINIVDLSLGEPDFRTPEHICNAAIKAMADGFTKYPPVVGFPDLLAAISTKLKRDNNLDYAPNEIIVSTGAKQSLANAILSIVDPGDEVLIPVPYWVTYSSLVHLAGGEIKFINSVIENDFKIQPADLEATISERTRLFIFSSPCNPTGSVYSKEELAGLAEVFKRFPRTTIISDEIYEYINYNGHHESIAQFTELKDRVVVINGMSKGFAMTGWRLGYMAGPRELVQSCEKLQAQFTSAPNSIAQKAAIAALLGDMGPTHKMAQGFRERRVFVIPALKNISGIRVNNPEGAFYAFPQISSFFGKSYGDYHINNDEDMAMYLLNEAHVATVCGSAFGMNDCIRISFANSMPNLVDAMGWLAEALGKLA